jgi:hypothetical protein
VCHLEDVTSAARHREDTDQLPDTSRVTIWDTRQIQEDESVAATKERFDSPPELGSHERSKGTFEVKDRPTVNTLFPADRHPGG